MWWKNMEEEYDSVLPFDIVENWECSGINPPLKQSTCSERWATIAYLEGMQARNDNVYATTVAYYISLVMTGLGVSCGSENIYFKDSLADIIFDILSNVKKRTDDLTETGQKKVLWNKIFAIFYKTGTAQAHEKTLKCGTLHIPRSMKNALKAKGTIHDAIVSLMKDVVVTPEKKVIVPSDEDKVQVTLQLTYSEQNRFFNLIPGDSPTQKVYWLLS